MARIYCIRNVLYLQCWIEVASIVYFIILLHIPGLWGCQWEKEYSIGINNGVRCFVPLVYQFHFMHQRRNMAKPIPQTYHQPQTEFIKIHNTPPYLALRLELTNMGLLYSHGFVYHLFSAIIAHNLNIW